MVTTTITYWGSPTPDGSGGKTFAAPVAIPGFWQDHVEQLYDNKGNMIVSRAVVFVDTDLVPGGYLFNGTSVATDPAVVTGAYEIKNFSKIPSIGQTKFERKAVL